MMKMTIPKTMPQTTPIVAIVMATGTASAQYPSVSKIVATGTDQPMPPQRA